MRVAALPVLSRQPAASRFLSWLLSPLFVLALSMVALAVFIPSFGDFPINDDWLYAQTVLGLSERGQLSLPAWGASSFVLQAYWGALFVKLLGFSHGALRVSTMLLAAVGVLGFYLLLRQLVDPTRALLGVLMLLFNPLFLHLSYSFMTDVPFIALAIWALFCFARAEGEARPSARWLLLGSSLAAAACLVRQLGALLPLSALLALGLGHGWRAVWRPAVLIAVLCPPVTTLALGAYVGHQRGPVREDALAWTISFWSEQGASLPGLVLSRLTASIVTLGLITLPLSLGAPVRWRALDLRRRGWCVAGVAIVLLVLGFVIRIVAYDQTSVLPFMKNVLTSRGFLGRDRYNGTLPESIVVPEEVLLVATVAAAVGGAVLVSAAVAAFSGQFERRGSTVVLVFGLLSLLQLALYHEFIDRYLLAVLPSALLMLLLVIRPTGSLPAFSLAGVIVLALWSVWWERDYLERRAALWEAGQVLVQRGVSPVEIDGAFEWNGWFRGQTAIQLALQQSRGDRTGRQLQSSILQALDLKRARWAVAYAPPVDISDPHVVAVVPYGRGQHAVALQRS